MSSPLTPAQLAALINADITANGQGQITGAILNNVLQQITSLLGLAFTFPEPVAVTAPNTLANLSNTPSSAVMFLTVNGQSFFSGSPDPAFTFSGQVLTWNAANAGIPLTPPDPPDIEGDVVTALYSY